MSEQPVHRHFRHFRELPLSMRVLFTGALMVVGLGYLFAILYVFAAHSSADAKPGLSVEDIKITYSGGTETTALEAALRGPMSGMLPQQDLQAMIDWIRDGADKRSFDASIESIVDQYCLSCHDGSNPHLSNLDGFDNVQTTVGQDTGTDLYTLVRVSHIHLFGLTFIFFVVGFIFCHAWLRPVWLKALIVATPFAGVIADVLGWYLTKVFAPFAWIVMIAGFFNGLSFAVMWIVSMYQMWWYRPPDHVMQNQDS